MSFDTYEASVESGQPIELYHFSRGTEDYYYTSAEDTIIYGGNNYVSRQIDRNAPDFSTEEGRARLQITLPTDDPVASSYVGSIPPLPLEVELVQAHRGDLLDARILWSGRILQASFRKQASLATLTAVASESALSRPVPPYTYQSLCNHQLYNTRCGISQASFKFTGIASSVSGLFVTVSGLTAAKGGTDWAVGGKIVLGNDERLITGQSVDVLTLQSPLSSDASGQSVDVYAGCDHTVATCTSKFSNALNFGGFPQVPGRNPFRSGL